MESFLVLYITFIALHRLNQHLLPRSYLQFNFCWVLTMWPHDNCQFLCGSWAITAFTGYGESLFVEFSHLLQPADRPWRQWGIEELRVRAAGPAAGTWWWPAVLVTGRHGVRLRHCLVLSCSLAPNSSLESLRIPVLFFVVVCGGGNGIQGPVCASQALFSWVTPLLKWGHGSSLAWWRNRVSLGMRVWYCHWVLGWETAACNISFISSQLLILFTNCQDC